MGGLLLYVEMVSILYTLHWLGEIGHLVQHWNLFGLLRENMPSERVHQRLKSLAKISRSVLH